MGTTQPIISRGNINILLVEDNETLGHYLKNYLIDKGLNCIWVNTAEQGIKEFNTGNCNFFILDIMLPDENGYSIATYIRKRKTELPILFLSAMISEEDRIKGFDVGADDYLTKPFSMDELLMRIYAIVRRIEERETMKAEQYQIGILKFDFDKRVAYVPNENKTKTVEVSLSHKEASMIKIFCEHRGEVVRREELLKEVWGVCDIYASRSMDVYLSKVRSILKRDPTVNLKNLHSIGYKLTFNKGNIFDGIRSFVVNKNNKPKENE